MTILRRSECRDAARRFVPRASVLLATTALVGVALIGAGVAAAGPAISQTTPVAFAADNTCTGEMIVGNGSLHTEINENLSSSGTLQSHMMYRYDGVSATGVVTGKRYIAQQTESHEFVFASSGTGEMTDNTTLHFIRQGEDGTLILGDDFYVSMKSHITANAAGIQSFHVDTSDQPCQ